MELPSKILEQNAFNTRPKIEEHMIIVVNNSTHEENISQPLQTHSRQCKTAVTFLAGYNGISKVTDKKKRFYFTKIINDEHYIRIVASPGAYEIEALNDEIKDQNNGEGHFTEKKHHFKINSNFGKLGSILEISPYNVGSYIDFTRDDSMGDLLGYKPKKLSDEFNISDYPVDILSFDNIFLD